MTATPRTGRLPIANDCFYWLEQSLSQITQWHATYPAVKQAGWYLERLSSGEAPELMRDGSLLLAARRAGQASPPSCRYYKAQQAGEEWRENGMVDPSTLAGLEEDSQRRVGLYHCHTPVLALCKLAGGCNSFCAPSNLELGTQNKPVNVGN